MQPLPSATTEADASTSARSLTRRGSVAHPSHTHSEAAGIAAHLSGLRDTRSRSEARRALRGFLRLLNPKAGQVRTSLGAIASARRVAAVSLAAEQQLSRALRRGTAPSMRDPEMRSATARAEPAAGIAAERHRVERVTTAPALAGPSDGRAALAVA